MSFFLVLLMGEASASLARAASPEGAPVTLDGHAASRLIIHTVKPEYPPVAKFNYIQGRVRLGVLVDPKGRVSDIHIISGEPLLAAAAFNAVKNWRYQPYVGPEGVSAFQTEVHLNFYLRTHPSAELPPDPEQDLQRQIDPPQIAAQPGGQSSGKSVRLKVFVDSAGHVLDAEPMDNGVVSVEAARNNLRRWKFRPAHWGALAIPWYLIVNVPI